MNCKQEIQHLRQLRDLDLKAMELQAKEYERRLETLNHEHRNIQDNQAKSVLREVYDSQHTEQNKKIQDLLDWKNNIIGKQVMLLFGWGIVVAVITILLTNAFKK